MIGELILISIGSILSFVLQTGAGFILAWPFRLLRSKESVRLLSQLITFFFAPCMIFSRVVSAVDLESLSRLWILPVFCVLYILLGTVMGHVLLCVQVIAGLFRRALAARSPAILADIKSSEQPASPTPARADATTTNVNSSTSIKTVIKDIILQVFLNPPVISLIFSILVACIPPAKYYLAIRPPPIVSSLYYVVSGFGSVTLPLSMVVLGANICHSLIPEELMETTRLGESLSLVRIKTALRKIRLVRHNSLSTLVLSVIGKQIIIPLVAVPSVWICSRMGLLSVTQLGDGNTVVLALLVMLIQSAAPSAMNLAVIATQAQNGAAEATAELLLAQYLVSPLFLTIWSAVFLWLVCSGVFDSSSPQSCFPSQ